MENNTNTCINIQNIFWPILFNGEDKKHYKVAGSYLIFFFECLQIDKLLLCFFFSFPSLISSSMCIDPKLLRKWLRIYEKMRRRVSKKKILALTSICLVALLIYCLYEWKILCSNKRLQTTIGKKIKLCTTL